MKTVLVKSSIDIHMKSMTEPALILMMAICFLTGCSAAQEPPAGVRTPAQTTGKKVLIVYLSRTQNTKAIAEIIHDQISGELIALELEKPYPENYRAIVDQVAKENETGFLPPLKTRIDGIEKYDVVFVGFPTWGMQMPPPVKSFLRQYNLSGKMVVPFNTNAGYGVGSGFQTVKDLCPNSEILEGFITSGGIERDGVYFVIEGEKEKEARIDIKKWLERIKFSAPEKTASN